MFRFGYAAVFIVFFKVYITGTVDLCYYDMIFGGVKECISVVRVHTM